ncbi:transcription elongation factor GreA [Patescibacteria group bacterium]|jgi:transcription elongation factor GreA|nr:transcription elongation factor GreA [Patescibacteria group bacterium]MCL5114690.1 transcription elongation factor GreA [Patescibacteria group bacterium]
MAKNYLTKERYEELKKELDELRLGGRQSVGERLRHAKELGDLSENAEYQAVREEQGLLEKRIADLEDLLENSSLIDKAGGGETVKVGSNVDLKKNGTETVSYTLVGSNEADPAKGLISNASPLGRALLGKRVGDLVAISAPKGEMKYIILKIK